MKKILSLLLALVLVFTLVGCATDADVVSHNLSEDAEYFRVKRKIVYINLFDSSVLLEVVGHCSVDKDTIDQQLEITCMTGENMYKKHFLDTHEGSNTTYFVEQLDYVPSDPYHYKYTIKPQALIPNIDIVTSSND